MPQNPALSTLCRAAALTGLLLTANLSAFAQWQWVDGTGRKVFSDTAPPASIPDKSILKRPGPSNPAVPMAPTTAATPAPERPGAPAAPQLPTVDKELEARKKQAEQSEEAKRKADEQRMAQARTENCERARKAKTALDSGVRLATTNAKGEREIMDDKTRAAESRRLDDVVRNDCAPMMPKPVVQ